jgi:ParB-like chromosome segregation protein Spo0J
MEVRQLSIKKLKPYPGNPRSNKKAVDLVAKSIERFGFRQPIVVDADMVIVAGHTRFEAAKRLKMETVPVHTAEDLSEEELAAYRLADNKVAEFSSWDLAKLSVELSSLNELCADPSELLIGFTTDELYELTQSVPDFSEEDEKDQPRLDQVKPKVCPECGHEFYV